MIDVSRLNAIFRAQEFGPAPSWRDRLDRLTNAMHQALQQLDVVSFDYRIVTTTASMANLTVVAESLSEPQHALVAGTYPKPWTRALSSRNLTFANAITRTAVRTLEHVYWGDCGPMPQLHFIPRCFDYDQSVSIPLLADNHATLVLMSFSPAVGYKLSDETISYLELLGTYFHQFVKRAYLEVSLTTSSRRSSVLSRRETEVLSLASNGLGSIQIARELGITAKSVDLYVEHARHKLGVHNRVHAVAKAVHLGLLGPSMMSRTVNATLVAPLPARLVDTKKLTEFPA